MRAVYYGFLKTKGVKFVNHIPDINTPRFLAESDVPKIKAAITELVRKYCLYRYDDPQTCAIDQCSLFGDIHCVAIDSPYSHIQNGRSGCKHFNTMPLLNGLQLSALAHKVCAYCHRRFEPTSNHQKYCTSCSDIAKRKAGSARQRVFKARQK